MNAHAGDCRRPRSLMCCSHISLTASLTNAFGVGARLACASMSGARS
jgi:hypothetical protein